MLMKMNFSIQVNIMHTSFKVRIFELDHGLTEYEEVKLVRIISKDYNLMILKD